MNIKIFLFFGLLLFAVSCLENSGSLKSNTSSGGGTDVIHPNVGWLFQGGSVSNVPGGSSASADVCLNSAVDSSGNSYCAGYTSGSLGEANGGGADVFITKVNRDGELVWITQLGAVTVASGGSNAGNERCIGVSVDASGNVYCAGYTTGNFGEAKSGASDPFVLKLNSSGALQWVTQLGSVTVAPGGSNLGVDLCGGVAVDSLGNVYCAGQADRIGEANGGGQDAFIMKLNSAGVLQWVTQLGAVTIASGGGNAGHEYCNAVVVDNAGNSYCAGTTIGNLGEVNGGSYDAFIMKLNSSGVLQWVSQLGGVTIASGGSNTGDDACLALAVDSGHNLYCGGSSTGNIGEANAGGTDAIIIKLNASGTLQWVKQMGSITSAPGGDNSGSESCKGIGFDGNGNIYCAGSTSGDMGEVNAGSGDAFVLKLNSAGTLQWLTQLGATTSWLGGSNSGNEIVGGLAVDTSGNSFTVGQTSGDFGELNGGSTDTYIMKLKPDGTF